VIVRDLDIERTPFLPGEAHAVLLVDANAVTPRSVPLQTLESVPRGDRQVAQITRTVEQVKFSPCDSPERTWARGSRPLRVAPIEHVLCSAVSERLDHAPDYITCRYTLHGLVRRDERARSIATRAGAHVLTAGYDARMSGTKHRIDTPRRALDGRPTR
jgi:hypothetical protein